MGRIKVRLSSPDAPFQIKDGKKLTGSDVHSVEETKQIERAITGKLLVRVTEPEPTVKPAKPESK